MGTKKVLASTLRGFFATMTGTRALRRIRSFVLPRKGSSVRDAAPDHDQICQPGPAGNDEFNKWFALAHFVFHLQTGELRARH